MVHLQIPVRGLELSFMTTISALPVLRSLGRELDPSPERLGYVTASNDILDHPAALRDRLERDGYLYIRNFFDPELILAARRSIFERAAREGKLDPAYDLMEGIVHPDKPAVFPPEVSAASPEIRRVVFGDEICNFYTQLFAEPICHFDYIWCRQMGPGYGTATHCDWVYMGRGSKQLLTCWIPYVDIPLDVGGLILLEKSHRQADRIANYLNKDVDAYCENNPDQTQAVAKDGKWSFPGWLSQRPDTMPEKFDTRWLTAREWKPGDFITFRMDLIHGSLDNQSNRVRLSTDTRYQPASHPADERWIGVNPPGHSLAGKRGRIC